MTDGQDSGFSLPCKSAAAALFKCLDAKGQRIALAESCTGGLAAAVLTEIPGSSRAFWGSVVSYSEEAKSAILGLPQSTLRDFGVVSLETAAAMAKGVIAISGVDIAAAVTGYAGPDAPDGEDGPGRVCFAWAAKTGSLKTEQMRFAGSRTEIREAACRRLLEGALNVAKGE